MNLVGNNGAFTALLIEISLDDMAQNAASLSEKMGLKAENVLKLVANTALKLSGPLVFSSLSLLLSS